MLSRPNDERLRRCAWTKDIDSVLPLFESAKKRLADLGVAWQDATPFPTTTEKLGSFSGHDWRCWILSVESSDADGVQALARFTLTCGGRLGKVNVSVDDLLQRLVDSPQETMGVELKPWILPTEHDGVWKIAKVCMALRNNNGGYLLLGFEDDGRPSPSPPADLGQVYHIDQIQQIVSKYASEPFAVTVEFRDTRGQTHPIVVVPDGVVTPVLAKSTLFDPSDEKRRLIEDDAIYVRSVSANNRVSSTKLRKSDIHRLMKICFDNREADIGAFLRRHLTGLTPELLQGALDAVQKSVHPSITPNVILNKGYERFSDAFRERGQELPDIGYWETAAVVDSLENPWQASQTLLSRLRAIRHNHSGWPPWAIIHNPGAPDMNPRVINGTWEALMDSMNDPPFPMLDYWQINPMGRFFYVRALEDDLREETHGVEPRTVLDFYLVVYRVTEAISAVLQITRELEGDKDHGIDFGFRWRALRGRILRSGSEPGRFLRPQVSAYDDIVTTEIQVPSDVPESTIPAHVYRAVRPLFLAFEGYDVPQREIEEIAADVLKRRM